MEIIFQASVYFTCEDKKYRRKCYTCNPARPLMWSDLYCTFDYRRCHTKCQPSKIGK